MFLEDLYTGRRLLGCGEDIVYGPADPGVLEVISQVLPGHFPEDEREQTWGTSPGGWTVHFLPTVVDGDRLLFHVLTLTHTNLY